KSWHVGDDARRCDDGDGVEVAGETLAVDSHLVGDDHVELLGAELLLRLGAEILGFGGEANPVEPGTGSQGLQDVDIGKKSEVHRPVRAPKLRGGDLLGDVI